MFLSAEWSLNREPGATRSHIVRSAIGHGPGALDSGLPLGSFGKRQAAARQGSYGEFTDRSMKRSQTSLMEGKEETVPEPADGDQDAVSGQMHGRVAIYCQPFQLQLEQRCLAAEGTFDLRDDDPHQGGRGSCHDRGDQVTAYPSTGAPGRAFLSPAASGCSRHPAEAPFQQRIAGPGRGQGRRRPVPCQAHGRALVR
jgi:hypothetical protein